MDKNLAIIVTVFISVLVGVILLGTVANEESIIRTGEVDVSNETVNAVTNKTQFSLAFDDIVVSSESIVVSGNDTALPEANYDIDYTNGLINFTFNSTYFVTYEYIPSTFVKNATARTLVSLVVLFFALAVLAIGFGWLRIFEDFRFK